MKYFLFFILIVFLNLSCEQKPLPILSPKQEVDGKEVPRKIRDFSFINQDSLIITNKDYEGKIYVSNNFFTSCPSICPTVTSQMLLVYEHFKDDDRIKLLSHSIDAKYDSIPVLKRYAEGLEVSAPKWNFVTGDEEKIHAIAYDYFSNVKKDAEAPGGFDHDDLMVLVDKNRHIRAFAHGMEPKSVESFIKDIEFLLESEY